MSDSPKIDWNAVHERLRLNEERLAEVLAPNPERVRRIQAERAARLASRRLRGSVEATIPMMIVEVGGEKVAIDVTATFEILRISSLTRVAGVPAEIRGVTNLRGEIYSVMDLHSFLRNDHTPGELAWGVALRHPALRIVLGVQAVLRIENIPQSALLAVEDNVLRIRDDIAIELDTRAILERLEAEMASVTASNE